MTVYNQLQRAGTDRDVAAYLDLLHDDYVFVRHQSGTEVSKADWTPVVTAMMESPALKISQERCLYENDEVLVMHQFMGFADGTQEAVLVFHRIQDGKIIRTESGATPIKSEG